MHLKNISPIVSFKRITALFILLPVAILGTVYGIFVINGVKNYITDIVSFLQIALMALLVFIFPLIIYACFIYFFIMRYKVYKKLKSNEFSLKSVDFSDNNIYFDFFKSQYNFTCSYNDVKDLELIIGTIFAQTKYSSKIKAQYIILNFTLYNNKQYSLTNVPFIMTNTIFKIIDLGQRVQNFSYKFKRDKNYDLSMMASVNNKYEDIDLKRKIEKYTDKKSD